MTNPAGAQTHRFEAEVSQVLSLVINSLYSNKDVFLRELISNAADALDKLRFEALSKPELLPEGHTPRIRLIPDEQAKTLTISDNGIGMTEEALQKDLGTVARSGSKELVERLHKADQAHDLKLIGQFGVGFYSGYLVADHITVISRPAGSDKAFKWSSAGKDEFTIEPAERDEVGTSVVLHLKSEQEEYAKEWRLRALVERYSDFVSQPIELQVKHKPKDEPEEIKFEAINKASALWMRSEKDVTDEQYNEFYKHLTHDWEAPLSRLHFHVEGTQMFSGLLYIPKRPPFDIGNPEWKHGVRLYVRRVFIMDNCEELLPRWLRFVRGVIDSDDLPLNVSRELLQDSAAVKTIKKQVIRRVLDLLNKLATDKPDEYLDFWSKFGPVLKEGLHFDPSQSEKIAPLLRYESSGQEKLTSLGEYVKRMPEGQSKIYYAQGPSKQLLAASPHLEALKKRGYEVLFMTHGIDQWAVEGLREFEGKKLVDAMQEDAFDDKPESEDKPEDESESKAASSEEAKAIVGLLARAKLVLEVQVSDVRASERLTDSPACLVVPRGGLPAHIERMLRAHQSDLPEQKRILELNPTHPLVQRMKAEHDRQADSPLLTEWIELLYDQALLIEGSPLPDPARFSKRLVALMQAAPGAGA
ncbi:MAG TPA: molecular chaperone HtpG [Polyangiales bacterium]|nr:molecular chaperone HtpG [Polyangiales bacterium]